MADVITRLKLESGEYDSKIKRATQGLLQMEQECRKVGKSMNDMDKDNRQFVQSLGSMETVSTSVRGKIGELSGAFVELRSQYNRLTEEEKKGDFGRAMSGSLEQLKTRVAEAKRELADITKELDGSGSVGGGGFLSGIGNKMSGALQVFGGNLLTKATMEVANLGQEMVNTVQQGIEMAKAGEGIRNAFARLGRGDILDGLREATHGTVTDLELMKAAVKFNDFKLPLDELGTMLAFAQQKAKDTGQSVDYMVDSIVTGLGRKSLMILDNLGLSAAEIKDKMAETGDMTKAVGAIIREQMAKAGDYVETAADRAAQANVSLQNKMEELGRKFAPVEEASTQLWTSMKIGILDVVGGPLARLLNGLTEAGRMKNMLDDLNGGENGQESRTDKALRILREYSGGGRGIEGKRDLYNRQVARYNELETSEWRQVNNLRKQREDFRRESARRGVGENDVYEIDRYDQQIAEHERKAKAWQVMRADYEAGAKQILSPVKPVIDTSDAEQSIDSLKGKLAELEAQRKKAIVAGDQDLAKNLTKQITQTRSDIKTLDPNALKTTTSQTLTKPEQADAKYVQAQKDYEQSLQQAALEVKAGTINSAEAKKKELQAAETLWKSIGDAREVYDSPKLKEAQAQVEAKMTDLGPEVVAAIEAQKASETAARELERKQTKLASAMDEASTAWKKNDLSSAFRAQDKAQSLGGSIEIPVAFTYTQSNMSALISKMKEDLSMADVGSVEFQRIFTNMQDATALGEFIKTAIAAGVDSTELGDVSQAIWAKILNKENIDPSVFEGLYDILGQSTGKNYVFDEKKGTAEVKEDKSFEEFSKGLNTVAGGLSSVTSGMKALGVEIPKEIDDAINVMHAIGQIIAGVQAVISLVQTPAQTFNTTALSFNTGAITALTLAIKSNTFTNLIPFFSNGGLVGRAADGMLIPGTSYSGDRLRMPVSGGGFIGVNSGELILNTSSQKNLAAEIMAAQQLVKMIDAEGAVLGSSQQIGLMESLSDQSGQPPRDVSPYVDGEVIWLGLGNYLKGAGIGRIVTTNN